MTDQRLERLANIRFGELHVDARKARPFEQNELWTAVSGLLVPAESRPRTFGIDPDGLWPEDLLDCVRGEAGEAKRGEETESDGLTMWQLVVRCSLERVSKGVPARLR